MTNFITSELSQVFRVSSPSLSADAGVREFDVGYKLVMNLKLAFSSVDVGKIVNNSAQICARNPQGAVEL